ncbi:uncharacterized protein ASPGLDRAFT_26507 [Aspergillus glaucus CBS 516.65]|uniref:Uncharacterized protein n=1 Tax=Aspergillus glaucus CBS 516.65 TaxID=1160497 RepID=A0A1L9VI68_ASPGL|nr:hypothetical protein ASPGLDRAFT_26507 [Aspergillus glaucus CBS 516.65]OJJ83627.1 hypothetical protein ASPGLDRAFT_26507 [Aspergillus glaucus CBS 516.65]
MNWSSHNIDPYLDPEGHHGSVEYPGQRPIYSPFPYTHFAHLSSAPFEWNMMPPLPPIDSSPSDTTWAIDAPTVESGTTDEGADNTELSNMSYGSTGNGHSTNSSPSTPMMDEPRRSVTASHKPAKGKASYGRCPTYRTQTTADHIRELIYGSIIS